MIDNFIDRSQTNAEKYTLREELFGTSDVIPLWVADMDLRTPEFIFEAIKKRCEHKILGYEEIPNSAYEAQIEWVRSRHGFAMKKEWLYYSHSVVASINLAIKAFSNVGDEVIVQTPVYPPFFHSVTNNDRKVLKNPLKIVDGNFTFDFDDLRSKITSKTKLLLLCSPHNPVGRVWKREELEELAQICLENNIKVLADEIHSDLIYKPNKHIPFASLSKEVENITITTYGVGKTFNLAGMAISTIAIANEKMREDFERVYESIHFAQGNTFAHIAFEEAYSNGQPYLEELMTHLGKKIEKLQKALEPFKDQISFNSPEGTYLALLNCKKMNLKDKELRSFFVKEAKLGLSAGISFGREGSGYMRLNFAVSSKLLDQVIEQLVKALNERNSVIRKDKLGSF
ncbi:MAG: putative C-S lyase [Helicobacteraceae bacterium]|nr:putative C-S lyase [Helicobacteraceae bacterium]